MDESMLGFLIGGGVCFLFLIIGIFIMISGFRNRKKAEESTSWPSVQGTIIEVRVEIQEHTDDDGDKSYRYIPRWKYDFSVSGMNYTGENISFSATESFSHESKAREALEQYPLHSHVQVFHNPTNPEEAVLVTGTEGTMGTIIWGGIIAFIMLVVIAILAIQAF